MSSQSSSLIESLEGRTMLMGASVVHDVLRVSAAPAASNTIVVANSGDGLSVDVTITSVTRRGVTKNFSASFPKSIGFTKIAVRGGAGADNISIGSEASPIALPALIDGKAGNDAIVGGDGNDLIVGGLGDDTLIGGKGDDVLFGKQGNDHLFGDEGNDTLWGGAGDDEVDGGVGDDKLGGIVGSNHLTGGAGADQFLVRSLEANPNNDFKEGEDTLTIVTKNDDGNKSPPV